MFNYPIPPCVVHKSVEFSGVGSLTRNSQYKISKEWVWVWVEHVECGCEHKTFFVCVCYRYQPSSNQRGRWLRPHPLTVFARSLQNAKESNLGHLNIFYILCCHFDEKSWGYHLNRGRISRESQRVRGWMKPGNIKINK